MTRIGITHPSAVTVTGTRSTGHREPEDYPVLFGIYIRPFALPDTRFYLGGATGIDSIALKWLARETSASLHVVVPGRLDDQPADARHAVAMVRSTGRLAELTELESTLDTPGYHARNQWMADRSSMVIGFPLSGRDSGGAVWTLEYARSLGLPCLNVPI
jgi:hypothetical protein